MATLKPVHDKADIEAFLRRDPLLHLYELGFLDSHGSDAGWFGWRVRGELGQIALLLPGGDYGPFLMLYARDPVEEARIFARALLPSLPRRLFAPMSPGLVDAFRPSFEITRSGNSMKMRLSRPDALAKVDGSATVVLDEQHADELIRFYARVYPGTYFNRATLATNRWRAVVRDGAIVSVAGLHIYSRAYRVAALGSVATDPAFRHAGLAGLTSAALCRDLVADGITDIGLEVRVDNAAAIGLYEGLGFTRGAVFQFCSLEAR